MKPLTNSFQLSKIELEGFKSIKKCELEFGALNILVGCNGAGKSNFIGFFAMIQQLLEDNLQRYVSRQGGPDALLHFGRKKTKKLLVRLYFGNNGYWCTLEPTSDNRLMFAEEASWWNMSGPRTLGSGHFETNIGRGTKKLIDDYVLPAMKQWRVYHFHDTGETATVKQVQAINDNSYLRTDASNLAAFLYLLQQKHQNQYQQIIKTIRLVAPFFGDFSLRPSPLKEDMIELEWREGGKDIPFKAGHLSDGTLRFICLATVLLQPSELQPSTIIIDEPELGLHPYAIKVLAALIRSTAKDKQIIVSTQSVELLNEFDPEDVVVVDRKDNASFFRRLGNDEFADWLEDYTLGELWQKNILGGRPAR
jgi:predicted ATPase